MVNANLNEFFTFSDLKINPCENETTKQSMPSAKPSNIKSMKFNFYLK